MRRLLPILATLALAGAAAARASPLPPEVARALRAAEVPADALGWIVVDVASGRTVAAANADRPMNPASVTKLLTTYAALDLLGPAWQWATPVWLQGRLQGRTLEGDVVIKGSGDPTLVIERVWLLVRRLRQQVDEIRGDVVLDDSAFAVPAADPAAFDGEPSRPYNAQPSALLFNFKAVNLRFVPDAAAGVARVGAEPALPGMDVDRSVPLGAGACKDVREGLALALDPARVHFAGRWPAACGEDELSIADPVPATYNARLFEALWRESGGRLAGRVRSGAAPAGVPPAFEWRSPALAEVVRSINKFSNNLMAQQLFLTLDLARHPDQPATPEGARELLRGWLERKLAGPVGRLADQASGRPAALPALPTWPEGWEIDNGSGLSRQTRLPPRAFARLLQGAWNSGLMPELMSSLPVAGADGTLRKSKLAPGRAHLKSGTLRDVCALAGWVLADDGRRYAVAAMIEHPNAPAARPALEALVDWVMRGAKPR